MNIEGIREVANAVLYEGYLLYPYRHSAIKNRRRWNFGVIYPRAHAESPGGSGLWTMRTECLMTGLAETHVDVTIRFLSLLRARSTPTDSGERRGALSWEPDTWEEGVEREIGLTGLILGELVERPKRRHFAFPASHTTEAREGSPGGLLSREQRPIAGAIRVAAERLPGIGGAFRLAVRVENHSPIAQEPPLREDDALLSAFVSTHAILQTDHGAFVSLLDPPDTLREAASACRNDGAYPVLAGDEGETSAMLASPIILYDYPRIAPESAGSLFDGTEIDEILTLRILALSDEEKEEMRQGDERARAILERTESLTADQLLKLHGVIRGLGPGAEGGGL